MSDPTSAVNLNMGTFVGSYENVAKMLDEVATVPGVGGVLLTFDDFVLGMQNFGKYIQPRMISRKHVKSEVAS
jgi:pyrimidine oxygenase